jgi:O-antigen/teichoic acid export membrane protein
MNTIDSIISKIINIGEVQRQSLISFFGQIVLTIIGFLSTIYFARTLGAPILGAYFLFLAYYSIASMITDGGFGGASVKRISEGDEKDAYFTASFVLRVLFTMMVVIILIAFRTNFVDLNDANLFPWLLIALIVSTIRGTFYNGIEGRGKMGISSAGSTIGDIAKFIIQIVAVFLGYEVSGLAGGFVASMIVATMIVLPFFDLNVVWFKLKHITHILTFSFWLFLTSSGILAYSYADRIIIGYYLGNADIGIYQVTVQLAALSSFATVALRSTLWPKVSYWGKNNQKKLIEKSLSKAINYSMILAIPAMVGGVFVGDRLLLLVYGEDFSAGYLALTLILIAQIVNVFQYLFTMYLGALDYQKHSFKATSIGAIGNIILNFALIPIIGISGAALATLITLTLNAFLANKYLSSIINVQVDHSSLINITVSSCIMGLFVAGYRFIVTMPNTTMTLIPIFLGGIIYFILIIKIDKEICNEFKKIVVQLGIPWPRWF